jgi:hypothetical protein
MTNLDFSARVMVFAPGGQILFAVHAERARHLVSEYGYLIRKRSGPGRKVREIEATEIAPRAHKPCSPPTLTQFMGQKYTKVERTKNAAGEIDGRVCQFKFIHPGDRALFMLSVTDCLVA